MMKCSRCKKRMAVVFITTMQSGEKHNEGLCLVCAKELGVPQVGEYMEYMGISEDNFEESYEEIFGNTDIDRFGKLGLDDDDDDDSFFSKGGDKEEDDDDEEDGVDSFKLGGAGIMPKFLKDVFEAQMKSDESAIKNSAQNKKSEKEKSNNKKEKKNKKRKFLDTFCTNITTKAKNGELDRIIGREKEIDRVIQILSRRTKNNPCLIGEPGVGKTAIAEGIAQRVVSGDVPFRLKNKEFYLLDLTVLIAGTQFRGQFESRVKSLVDEIKQDGNIIIFIDEVHNLVGTGDSEGTMNAANMFKPALSRGEMQVIGATTFGEYRKYIEKDGALERRFQPVTVVEPTIDETFELLKGIKSYYENHHKIKVSDSVLRSCAVLSERYINDRFLPDKAIDLLDEAAACASIRNNDLNLYEKLKEENSGLDKKREELLSPKDGEIDHVEIAELKSIIARNNQKLEELEPIVSELEITENDISTVIELWTGIPAAKILQTEFKKIAQLANSLKKRIIGQDEACDKVASAICRSRVRLSKRKRPSSFIFVGPTGVGKTELVKVLAEEMFDNVEPLIRLDMSEFMEKHSISRIIGSPPGYVGYDEAGQLTEKVRRRPYSVVLFDEIEKAHPDVMNILLQILDEGKVNDAQGRTISFENTVIAMTSNAGSTDKSTGVGFAKTEGQISRDKAMKALKDFLRPEFMARVDEVVVFEPLTEETCAKIAKLMIEEMREPLKEKEIELNVSEDVYTYIAKKSSGGKYGGRDIRRTIRDEIENAVAMLIVEGGESGIEAVNISVEGENFDGIIVK